MSARDLLTISENQLWLLLFCSITHLPSISFLVLSLFPSLYVIWAYFFSLSNILRKELKSLIYSFSSLISVFIIIIFSSNTALAASYKFWHVIFSLWRQFFFFRIVLLNIKTSGDLLAVPVIDFYFNFTSGQRMFSMLFQCPLIYVEVCFMPLHIVYFVKHYEKVRNYYITKRKW